MFALGRTGGRHEVGHLVRRKSVVTLDASVEISFGVQ